MQNQAESIRSYGTFQCCFLAAGSVNRAVGVQQGWPSAIIALLVGGVKTWGHPGDVFTAGRWMNQGGFPNPNGFAAGRLQLG